MRSFSHLLSSDNVLFLSSDEGRPVPGRSDDPVSAAAISSYGRVDALYRVTRFSPNEVIIEAEAPVDRPAWLLYSDIWHPNWKAEVNAKAVPVYAANLAYKAVPLVPGKNVVRFYFHAPLMIFFYWFFAVQGVIAMGILGWMFLTNRREYA